MAAAWARNPGGGHDKGSRFSASRRAALTRRQLERQARTGHCHGMPTPPARFTGFDRTAMQFWHELAAEMNREWFTAHKAALRAALGGADDGAARRGRPAARDYKKVPAGFPADHPRAELLKMKGLTGGCSEIPRGLIHKPGFAGWLVKHGKAMAPLVIWLHRHVR
jgi:uncharacterized protein DUF2461